MYIPILLNIQPYKKQQQQQQQQQKKKKTRKYHQFVACWFYLCTDKILVK